MEQGDARTRLGMGVVQRDGQGRLVLQRRAQLGRQRTPLGDRVLPAVGRQLAFLGLGCELGFETSRALTLLPLARLRRSESLGELVRLRRRLLELPTKLGLIGRGLFETTSELLEARLDLLALGEQ